MRRPIWFVSPAVLSLILVVSPAGAAWRPMYFFFDRAQWSADGRAVAVLGRAYNGTTREVFEDTLLVDLKTGEVTCVSPKLLGFVLSKDGRRILGRGPWGLFDHDFQSGKTLQLLRQHPMRPNEILEFSYTRDVKAAVCIICSDNEPERSGVYTIPLDGTPSSCVLADESCGPQLLNFWQVRRRDLRPGLAQIPSGDRPTTVENFPGSVWQLQSGDRYGVAVWGNGEAGSDTLCWDCRVVFVSSPRGGGRALISTSVVDLNDVLTPGDLWLVSASKAPIHLGRGRFEEAAWPDSTYAFLAARPGHLFVADALEKTLRAVDLADPPTWLTKRPAPSATVWTIRLPELTFVEPDSARAWSLSLKDMGVFGYALDPVPDGRGGTISVGAFPDSAQAALAAKRLSKSKGGGAFSIYQRRVSAMLGQFDFGAIDSPDGSSRIFFRTHPHMFQPYAASEVWLETKADRKRRRLIEPMASF